MNPSLLASVIIPSFNCAEWLEQSVASAFRLSETGIEVIVIDDGSTDETQKVCEALMIKHPGLKVIRQKNAGLSAARNAGIAAGSGKYIILLDADDELIRFDIRKIFSADQDVIRVGAEVIKIDGSMEYYLDTCETMSGAQYLKSRLVNKTFFVASCFYFYNRNWLINQGIRFKDGLLHEDYLFTPQALLKARSISATTELAYRYKLRHGSITTSLQTDKIGRRANSLIKIFDEIVILSKKHPDTTLAYLLHQLLDEYHALCAKLESRSMKWRGFVMEARLLLSNSCWGGNSRTKFKWRLRLAIEQAIFNEWPLQRLIAAIRFNHQHTK